MFLGLGFPSNRWRNRWAIAWRCCGSSRSGPRRSPSAHAVPTNAPRKSSTFQDPAVDADEVQAALRALAHATRSIDDPRQIYSVLGSLTAAVASLSQSLHQLAAFHGGSVEKGVWVAGDARAGRAAAYQVSWELHRAAEIMHHVSDTIGRAHNAESKITYTRPDGWAVAEPALRAADHGLSL